MRHSIRFLLGDRVHELHEVDPNRTVLDYLRRDCRRTGTKEGCAEGDCGACTVAIGERLDGRLRYRAVNACIQFLPTLDGKQLVTVEDLGRPGRLHPVQQALVDHHGSQCGFCTPGFVMSLFCLYHEPRPPDRLDIIDALAGNLCRCTGYGPIIEAAEAACTGSPDDACSRGEAAILERLAAIEASDSVSLEGPAGRYFAPRRLDEAVELASRHPEACLLAGATDVGLWVTKQARRLDPVIYLGQVEELRRLRSAGGYLEIGAAVTLTEAMPELARRYPEFGELLRRYGARQVRNQATLGGNVANGSPIGDSPPPLMALGSTVELVGPEGTRELPLGSYFLDYGKQDRRPGEILVRLRVPLPRPGERLGCYKVSKRFDQDISAVCAAFLLGLDDDGRVQRFRAAFGGMAATPRRAPGLERAVLGQPWTEATVEAGAVALATDFTPIDDLRASADYRTRVAANLLRKFHLESGDSPPATRLFGATEHAHGLR